MHEGRRHHVPVPVVPLSSGPPLTMFEQHTTVPGDAVFPAPCLRDPLGDASVDGIFWAQLDVQRAIFGRLACSRAAAGDVRLGVAKHRDDISPRAMEHHDVLGPLAAEHLVTQGSRAVAG